MDPQKLSHEDMEEIIGRHMRQHETQFRRYRREIVERAARKAYESGSALIRAAVELIERADESWTTLRGTLLTWDDEEVKDEGRRRYDLARGRQTDDTDDEDDGADDIPGVDEEEHEFVITRSPWRLRLDRLRGAELLAEESKPFDVVVQNGRTWWASSAGVVKSGKVSPDRQILLGDRLWRIYGDAVEDVEDNRSDAMTDVGTQNLDLLVKPFPLLDALEFTLAEMTDVGDRRAILLEAEPTAAFRAMDMPENPVGWPIRGQALKMWIAGVDLYRITVDERLGIILSWEAFIDDRLASRQSISQLVIDSTIDTALFEPPQAM